MGDTNRTKLMPAPRMCTLCQLYSFAPQAWIVQFSVVPSPFKFKKQCYMSSLISI